VDGVPQSPQFIDWHNLSADGLPGVLPLVSGCAEAEVELVRRHDRVLVSGKMKSRARPGIGLRPGNKACADRIQFNVPEAGEPVSLGVDRETPKTPLPEASSAFMPKVEDANIQSPKSLQELRYASLVGRRDHEVKVVRHQRVTVDGHRMVSRLSIEHVEEVAAIEVVSKDH
jgi:hypothetical protein